MKQAHLKELQSLLLGSVTDNPDAIEHFSTDQSIFKATPTAIAYPQNTADVRKIVQFAAERTASGKPLPLIPRGKGSDHGGAAVGEGMQVVFPAHMNKLLRLDTATVTVQPGILFQTLQQTLFTHGRFVAQCPSGAHYSTVGGVVASGAGAEKSVKYGSIRAAVRGLKVVLSDGSLIETGRIGARELSRKKGLATLEGGIYRKFDSLLQDNADLIESRRITDVSNYAGYDLWDVRPAKGYFDLSQVIIGSQGTLGIITEITFATTPHNPRTSLLVGFFDSISRASEAIVRLQQLAPSTIELVDRHILQFHHEQRSSDFEGLIPEAIPKLAIFVEFDNYSQFAQKLRSTRAANIMRRHGGSVRLSTDPVEQVALWKIRRASVATWLSTGPKKALPFIDAAAVPVEKLAQLLEKTYKLIKKHDLEPGIWGNVGSGNIRMQPRIDLGKKKDIDLLFTLEREYAALVSSLGGTPSGGSGDSLLRAAGLKTLYGDEFFELLVATKRIFDPQNIFNPTHKTGATLNYAREHLREDFHIKHLHDYFIYT